MSEKVNKLALVTGGSRGLGFVAAKRFAQAGFRVVLTSRSEAHAEEAATTIRRELPGAEVQGRALDLSSFEDVRAWCHWQRSFPSSTIKGPSAGSVNLFWIERWRAIKVRFGRCCRKPVRA